MSPPAGWTFRPSAMSSISTFRSCRRLCPPHRPYRPRGTRRHRDLDRHVARQQIDRRDRTADRTNHSARRRRLFRIVGSDWRHRPATRTARKGRFPRRPASRAVSRDPWQGGEREPRHAAERQPHPAAEREPHHAAEREPRQGGEREARHGGEREARHGEREPRRAKGAGRNAAAQASTEAFTPPAPAPASRVPSIGRAEPRRVATEADSEPADHSHLPAFLLRPVRTALKPIVQPEFKRRSAERGRAFCVESRYPQIRA